MVETDYAQAALKPKFSQPDSYDLYRAAVKLARSRSKLPDGTIVYKKEFTGVYNGAGENLRVNLLYSEPQGEKRIEVSLGENNRGNIKWIDQEGTSAFHEYRVDGDLPDNLLEILSNLKPQD